MTLKSLFKAATSHLATTVAVPLLALGLSLPAQAFPDLDLDSDNSNDLYSPALIVDYNAGSRVLSVNSFQDPMGNYAPGNLVFADGSPNQVVSNLNFSLSATMNATLDAFVGGSLNIFGTVAGHGGNHLLSGSLDDFGFNGAHPDPMQFIFNVNGGVLSSLFGSQMGVILSSSGFLGAFNSHFGTMGMPLANADTFSHSVPEPALLFIGLLGCGLVSLSRRRA